MAVSMATNLIDEPELASLLDDAQDGRADAFELLVRRVQARIHAWAIRFTGDADAAEDVAQEVLIRQIGRASCRERV